MSRFLRLHLSLLLSIAAMSAVAVACSSSGTPQSRAFTAVPPSDQALSVGFVAEGEQVLNGWLFGAENDPVVILSNMESTDQTAWAAFAQTLAENGYAALTFDYRGYGISPGTQDNSLLDEDLDAAVTYMKARDRQQIFLVGASMGGTASIAVAAMDDVSGVISISAPTEFDGLHADQSIADVREPVLLLAAADDTAASASLDDILANAPQGTRSETYAGDEHGTDLVDGAHADQVQADILEFLGEHTN